MNEIQLRVVLGLVQEPEVNKVDLSNRKLREEVSKMVRIFKLAKVQKQESKVQFLSNLSNLEPVLSFN